MNETNPHLTRAEIEHILDHARHPDQAAEAANAHLLHCESCRRALRAQAPAIEERLKRLFSQLESAELETEAEETASEGNDWPGYAWAEAEWMQSDGAQSDWLDEDSACIAPEDLSRYVARELPAPQIKQIESHLEECRLCRRDVRQLRELQQDVKELLVFLPAPIAVALQPAPAPDVVAATPAEAPHVVAPPAEEKTTAWQRWREKWLPTWQNSLFPLTAGAAFAAGILIIGFLMPLRQQLHVRDEAYVKEQAKETAAQNARFQAEHAQVQQSKIQLAQRNKILQKMQRDLQIAREQQKQNPLAGAVLLAGSATGEHLYHDKQGIIMRSQPFEGETILAEGRSHLADVAFKPERTMGSGQGTPATIELLTPVGRIISSPTPQFQWRPLVGGASYQVQIKEVNTGIEVPPSGKLTAAAWTPHKPLRSGVLYSWQVVATDSKGVDTFSESRKFKVLDAQMAARIDKLAGSPLLRGLLYVQAGMPDEAKKELTQAQQTDSRSPLAHLLAQQVQALLQTSEKHQVAHSPSQQ